MPHSLRARLNNLRYKKIISDKDYDRLCKALDNDNVLDKVRAEIEQMNNVGEVIQIINKYKGESEKV